MVDQRTGEDLTEPDPGPGGAGRGARSARPGIPRQVLARLIRLAGAARRGVRTEWSPPGAPPRAGAEAERIVGGLLARGRLTLEEAAGPAPGDRGHGAAPGGGRAARPGEPASAGLSRAGGGRRKPVAPRAARAARDVRGPAAAGRTRRAEPRPRRPARQGGTTMAKMKTSRREGHAEDGRRGTARGRPAARQEAADLLRDTLDRRRWRSPSSGTWRRDPASRQGRRQGAPACCAQLDREREASAGARHWRRGSAALQARMQKERKVSPGQATRRYGRPGRASTSRAAARCTELTRKVDELSRKIDRLAGNAGRAAARVPGR